MNNNCSSITKLETQQRCELLLTSQYASVHWLALISNYCALFNNVSLVFMEHVFKQDFSI